MLTVFHYTDGDLNLRILPKGEGWLTDARTQPSSSVVGEIDRILLARIGDGNPPRYFLTQARKALQRGYAASGIKAMRLLHQQNPWTPPSFFSLRADDMRIAVSHSGALTFRTTVAKGSHSASVRRNRV